jgi:uncharacterized protein
VRVALDTNVLVSAVATRGICADVLRVVLTEHELVVGARVVDELRRVLADKMRVPSGVIDDVVELLRREAFMAHAGVAVQFEIRDPTDLVVVTEAVAGGATVLVTGDSDLLDAADRAPLAIVSPRAFWERIRSRAAADDEEAEPA